jgi:serine/threonine protein kinase
MGVVYQAEETALRRHVALKVMLPALAVSPTARQRFLREARAAAAIEHDHIVAIYRVDEDRGIPFLAMPFLKGEPLETRLNRERRLTTAEVLRIGREIAEGLRAAHERGLVHRDIKPANIWLEGERSRVKILDFGLARSAGGEGRVTQSGAILGTPAYMSPEQAAGETVDGRSDLFSLGCVLYRMCTGQLAFTGPDSIATLLAVASVHPRAPHEINPDVPPVVSQLVMRLLAKKREDRPQMAKTVVEEIEAIENGSPLPGPTRPPSPAARPWLFGLVVGTLFVAALTLAAVGWWVTGILLQR